MKIMIPEPNTADEDFEALLGQCGKPIGSGGTREAYAIPSHNDKVLKVCKVPGYATNWTEIVVYLHVKDKSFFGCIHSWSRSGKFIVMERLDDIGVEEISGLEAPNWWTDRKRSNVGRSISGELKLRDYAALSIEPGVLFRF
ncbi:hypothetical protein [Burkholderia ubonensis]|uniref:hypothetical protein n=1 Tax=Burkholderia ubonensis TaxID=101571 RepID=UPI000755C61E|nr:hypothetical protein [Burkholderia ubonensis]KVC86943.1 hypothetical protein WI75_30380 [Burkholderia ubonensis]KVO43845.1 hypothetical protein WJ75_00765 [Burkholderia ubonensis]KVV36022.1 hypothetical protein WK81_27695 [Burkholderia ubonensis]KWC22058.1 hypothetical protein WL49_07040 [Burkholderia ubonensis]KWC22088.1 hypothetical protein WL48_33065 [Burkholderia ubonensis]